MVSPDKWLDVDIDRRGRTISNSTATLKCVPHSVLGKNRQSCTIVDEVMFQLTARVISPEECRQRHLGLPGVVRGESSPEPDSRAIYILHTKLFIVCRNRFVTKKVSSITLPLGI